MRFLWKCLYFILYHAKGSRDMDAGVAGDIGNTLGHPAPIQML